MYKIVSNMLLSRLTPYAEEITGDHQCGIRHNTLPTNHIFCICHILETKWEYHEAVHQLFTDSKKAYDSVGREVLYNTVNEFGIPDETGNLKQMCLNEIYSTVRVDKHLRDLLPSKNGLKQAILYSHNFSTLL
jgi:hypothetical protein